MTHFRFVAIPSTKHTERSTTRIPALLDNWDTFFTSFQTGSIALNTALTAAYLRDENFDFRPYERVVTTLQTELPKVRQVVEAEKRALDTAMVTYKELATLHTHGYANNSEEFSRCARTLTEDLNHLATVSPWSKICIDPAKSELQKTNTPEYVNATPMIKTIQYALEEILNNNTSDNTKILAAQKTFDTFITTNRYPYTAVNLAISTLLGHEKAVDVWDISGVVLKPSMVNTLSDIEESIKEKRPKPRLPGNTISGLYHFRFYCLEPLTVRDLACNALVSPIGISFDAFNFDHHTYSSEEKATKSMRFATTFSAHDFFHAYNTNEKIARLFTLTNTTTRESAIRSFQDANENYETVNKKVQDIENPDLKKAAEVALFYIGHEDGAAPNTWSTEAIRSFFLPVRYTDDSLSEPRSTAEITELKNTLTKEQGYPEEYRTEGVIACIEDAFDFIRDTLIDSTLTEFDLHDYVPVSTRKVQNTAELRERHKSTCLPFFSALFSRN